MVKREIAARLACGCRLAFRENAGGPVTVIVQRKAETCTLSIHVAGMPLYDQRAAMRPATRLAPPPQPDYEEEG